MRKPDRNPMGTTGIRAPEIAIEMNYTQHREVFRLAVGMLHDATHFGRPVRDNLKYALYK